MRLVVDTKASDSGFLFGSFFKMTQELEVIVYFFEQPSRNAVTRALETDLK